MTLIQYSPEASNPVFPGICRPKYQVSVMAPLLYSNTAVYESTQHFVYSCSTYNSLAPPIIIASLSLFFWRLGVLTNVNKNATFSCLESSTSNGHDCMSSRWFARTTSERRVLFRRLLGPCKTKGIIFFTLLVLAVFSIHLRK